MYTADPTWYQFKSMRETPLLSLIPPLFFFFFLSLS
jgi:hypothetical protein